MKAVASEPHESPVTVVGSHFMKNSVRLKITLGWFFVLIVALSGCQSDKCPMPPRNAMNMVLDRGPEAMDLTGESIGLFTLETLNMVNPLHTPEVRFLKVAPDQTEGKDISFLAGSPHGEVPSVKYLISMKLPPGVYEIGDVSGESTVYVNRVRLRGCFCFPLNTKFTLPPNAIVYLGHVIMVNQKAKEGEPKSGPKLHPLQDPDAAVLEGGYWTGTFGIDVSDGGDTDIPLFRKEYDFLADSNITTLIMTSQQDRPIRWSEEGP